MAVFSADYNLAEMRFCEKERIAYRECPGSQVAQKEILRVEILSKRKEFEIKWDKARRV